MKKLLLLIVILTLSIVANAEKVKIDGIYYNLNDANKTAEVTYYQYSNNSNAYLDDVIIPNDVTYNNITYIVNSIGEYAFRNCSNLTSVKIPNSITTIGQEAFYNSGWYNNQADGLLYLDNCLICYKGEKPTGNVTINDGTRIIAERTFNECRDIISISIPSSVVTIGLKAFRYCTNLISITIPQGVVYIGDRAFSNCSGLVSATIPNSVQNIGGGAFEYCNSLYSVTIPDGVPSIEWDTFMGCSSLTTVILPNSLTSIGNRAFSSCSNLASISIPDGVTFIGEEAFRLCTSIQSVNIPSGVNSIGYGTFDGCNNLSSINIPNGITTIGISAFSGCSKLESIIIPDGVTSIGSNAFSGCSCLTSITIPNGITNIEESTFAYCYNLSSLILPENLFIVKKEACKNCYNLGNITIPASVEYIYQEAFAGCNSLKEIVTQPITPPFLYDNSFSDFSVPLKVPKGCKKTYQSAQGWKNFTNISDADKYRLIYIVDNIEYKSYEIEEGETISPEAEPIKEGYTFSGWSEIPQTMPAYDVTVTGTFSINKYKLTYTVDSEEYKTYEVEYGATITPEAAPTKEGYTFSGWNEIPETMPAHDVTVKGTFSINKYKLTYAIDGAEYKTYEIEFGATITPEPAPAKEGHTFSGWSEIPETMPAYDVTITGTFSINSYKLTYMIDDKVYKEMMYEYGATITPEPQPEGDYQTFEWTDLPQTMPAHDVLVYASYTSRIIEVLMASQQNVRIYSPNGKKLNKLQNGLNIVILNDGTVKKIVTK